MSSTLWIAAVINAAFYVLQHLTKIYFEMVGGAASSSLTKTEVHYFSAHTLGMLGMAALILIWTVMLPVRRQRGQIGVHGILVCTAALNLVLAAGVHGTLVTMAAREGYPRPIPEQAGHHDRAIPIAISMRILRRTD